MKDGRLSATYRKAVEHISSNEAARKVAHSTILVNEAHIIAPTKAKTINQNCAGTKRIFQEPR